MRMYVYVHMYTGMHALCSVYVRFLYSYVCIAHMCCVNVRLFM